MSNIITAEILNIDVILKNLTDLEQINFDDCLETSGTIVENAAKQNLISGGHVKTGTLVDSIKHTAPKDNEVEIGTTVPYATYVEYGTGKYAVNGAGRPGWWVYVDEECGAPKSKQRIIYDYQGACRTWHILAAKYGPEHVHMTQGQKPTRFLTKGLENSKDEVVELFAKKIKEKTDAWR